MINELRQYVEEQRQGGIPISKTIDLLRRYVYLEQSCVHALAGWFIRTGDWEAKISLGYRLFHHAERAHEWLNRMDELRGGNRHVNIEPGLSLVGEELVHAPDEKCFVSGLTLVLDHLARQYHDHLEAADRSANALEIRILQRHLADIEREMKELARLHPSLQPQSADEVQRWTDYVDSLLASCGGVGGMAAKGSLIADRPANARFAWPIPMIFDEKLQTAELGTYESKMSLPLRERCIGEFEVYFNEFYAAAILATIIFDARNIAAPKQFYFDMAHHFWDEVRHAEFGAMRLRELGVEPSKVNMVLFDLSRSMPLLHRLCHLTLGLEVYFMPRKTERVRYYEEHGDFRSQLLADVDWSDEVNHVRYGKRWVEHFLQDDIRTVGDLQSEISEYMAQFVAQMPPGRKAPW